MATERVENRPQQRAIDVEVLELALENPASRVLTVVRDVNGG
jgi:hypothetical protein